MKVSMTKGKDQPKLEFRRIPNNPTQIRALTHQSGGGEPIETIVDVIHRKKRARAKSSSAR